MSDFYCGGCCKWARKPHDCPGRPIKPAACEDKAGNAQRRVLLRRKAELERELNEVNLRLGVVQNENWI